MSKKKLVERSKRALRPADQPDYTKKAILEALFECYGIVSAACRKVGITRETYYQWYRKDPEFAKGCDDTEISTHGMVEDKLLSKIMQDDTTALIFYCKTKMKKRGYVERIETTGIDGRPIESTVNFRTNQTDEQILAELKSNAVKEYLKENTK